MRRVLRRREIVEDAWRAVGARTLPLRARALTSSCHGSELPPVPQTGARAQRRCGVRVAPADKIEDLSSVPSTLWRSSPLSSRPAGEGRGYTQGRLLRTRLGFKGELRAVGAAVKRDLIFALARCGFDAFEVAPGEEPRGVRSRRCTATPSPTRRIRKIVCRCGGEWALSRCNICCA